MNIKGVEWIVKEYKQVKIMGVVVLYWYDAFCFVIVGASMVASVWVIWTKEWSVSRLETSRVLWTTSWRGLHPASLFATRLVSFILLATFLYWDLNDWGATIFLYYTEWTFGLVMLYFAIGSVISAYGCWLYYYSKDGASHIPILDAVEGCGDMEENTTGMFRRGKEAGFWGFLMQIAYQTCAGAVILTDVVFWSIIVPLLSNSHLRLNLLMGCMHSLNVALLLVDTLMNRLPFPWFRIAYFVVWSSAYVLFQWVIHLVGFSWWPYPFLELSMPSAPLWYLLLALIHIVCYGLYALIVKAKESLLSRIYPDSQIH